MISVPRRRALIVDDDPILRTVAGELLAQEGFDCTEFDDGEAALAALPALAKAPPELLLTDLVMPHTDGFAVIEAARKLAPDMRIIAISGGFPGMEASLLLSMAETIGADAVTAKPLVASAFVALVRKVLAEPPPAG